MTIWKLKPVDPGDHNWRASKYAGTVFVRARDKDTARFLAMKAFGKFVELTPDKKIPLQTWNLDRFATCEHVADSGFEEDGPDEVLGPDEALAKAHPSQTDNG